MSTNADDAGTPLLPLKKNAPPSVPLPQWQQDFEAKGRDLFYSRMDNILNLWETKGSEHKAKKALVSMLKLEYRFPSVIFPNEGEKAAKLDALLTAIQDQFPDPLNNPATLLKRHLPRFGTEEESQTRSLYNTF